MRSSHALDAWLTSCASGLGKAGITATVARGPSITGRPSATWISFETVRSVGRAVLWSSGRCQLDALSHDGKLLCATERELTTEAELDEALTHLTGCLLVAPVVECSAVDRGQKAVGGEPQRVVPEDKVPLGVSEIG